MYSETAKAKSALIALKMMVQGSKRCCQTVRAVNNNDIRKNKESSAFLFNLIAIEF